MVHILSAEWGWLDRCGGTARGAALSATDYPTLKQLFDQWHQVEGYVREYLSTLRNEDLSRVVEFAFGAGPKHAMPLGELMHHAAIHGIHHRGQVALLLRALGYVPATLTFSSTALGIQPSALGRHNPSEEPVSVDITCCPDSTPHKSR